IFFFAGEPASTPARILPYAFSNTRGTLQMKWGRVSLRLSPTLSRFSANAVVSPCVTPRNDSSRANECASGRNKRCTHPSWTGVACFDAVTAATWLPWYCITPFCGPVVPDVYTIVDRRVGQIVATRWASVPLFGWALSPPCRLRDSQVISSFGGCCAGRAPLRSTRSQNIRARVSAAIRILRLKHQSERDNRR